MKINIKILNILIKKIKIILFFYFIFSYKEFYALDNRFINNNINYQSDIIKYDIYKNKSYLIGNALIKYNNTLIQANYIEINWKKNTIHAVSKYNNIKNESNIKKILIINNNKKYYCDNFLFNLKTQIGIGNNFLYEEKYGILISKNIKKKKENIFLMNESFYTNDNYFKNKKDSLSDYFFKTKFIKNLNNKFLITGPILMYLYHIPTPIFIPFLYFYRTTKSGLKFFIPNFGQKNNNNFFIENLGFFSSISKNWDIRIISSFYNKKNLIIDTKTRYYFNNNHLGKINFFYKKILKLNNNSIYKIKWNHIKINKKFTFFTDINFLKKNYYLNKNFNIYSITFKKYFERIPLRLIITNYLNHDLNKRVINMSVPNIKLLFHNINPFKDKYNNLLKNFKFNYDINIKNIFNYKDNYFFSKKMFDFIKTKIKQDLLINTKIFKYFIITPNIIYNENIIFYNRKNSINNILLKINKIKLGINLFFTLYRLKIFKNKILKINTKIGYLYSPIIFKNYFLNYQKINFLISNTLTLKDKNNLKKNDHLNIFTTYNIYKTRWSDILFNGNKTIKNFLFNIKGRLYIYKNNNYKNIIFFVNKISKFNKVKILYLKNCLISIGYKINNNIIINNDFIDIYKKKGEIRYEKFFFDDYNYAHYKIFWNLKLKINYNYKNFLFTNLIDQNLLLKLYGSIYPTPFWRIGINLDYDIINKRINNALFIFDRDLRSFKLKFIWSPNNIWYFYLGINYKMFNN